MKKWVFFFILFLTSLTEVWALSPEENLFRLSVEFYRKGEFAQSAKATIKLIRLNPNKSLYWFNLGNCAFMLNKFQSAQKYYQKVISLKGNLALPAQLYQAKALRKLKRLEEARYLLVELIESNPPAGIRAEAQTDLGSIEDQQEIEAEAMDLYQAGKYADAQNQLLRIPESELSIDGDFLLALTLIRLNQIDAAEELLRNLRASKLLTGKDRPTIESLKQRLRMEKMGFSRSAWVIWDLSYATSSNLFLDGKSLSPVSGPLLRTHLGAGFQFFEGNHSSGKLAYIFDYDWPEIAPSAQIQSHTLQLPLLYRGKTFEFTLRPYHQVQILDRSLTSQRSGLMIRPHYSKDFFEFGLEAEGSSQKANHPNYDFLNGSSHFVRPYLGLWGRLFYGQLFWSSGLDGTQDITYTDGSVLPLKNTYQGPGLKFTARLSDKATLYLDASYLKKNYAQPALPSNKTREDQETALSLKFSYSLFPHFTVYCLGERISNQSTLQAGDIQDKNYEATTLSTGFSWNIY